MTLKYNRRQFTSRLAAGTISFHLAPALFGKKPNQTPFDDIDWYNVQDWGAEGKGWTNTKRYFDRLPAKAEAVVRQPVWDLSRDSAGMAVHFSAASSNVYVRYKLRSERLAMPHMPATGVSGLDLYGQDDQGISRWVSVVRPDKQDMDTTLAKDMDPGPRQYTLYLPLYNGVESLEIGVTKGTTFNAIAPRAERSIVFYGTSIMHGACASRPGMSISGILGRRLKRPVINLGFSGNGRMEPEVGTLLAELDPCVYAIDCLPNMDEAMIQERAVPLVKQLRSAHPQTPILLVEDRSFTNTAFFPSRRLHHQNSRAALKKAYVALLDAGIVNLYYLEGEQLLGLDGEAATDGSHPNDMGMVRYADAYEPVLRAILKQY